MNIVTKEDKKRIIKMVEKALNDDKPLVIFSEECMSVTGNPVYVSGSIVFGIDVIRRTDSNTYKMIKKGLKFIESSKYIGNKEDKDND